MSIKDITAFALTAFCAFFGFLAAVSLYMYYGVWLHQDLPANLTAITYFFIGQSVGGTVASIFAQNKSAKDE